MQYIGEIHLIIGPMYSGKTTELLRLYNRYYLAGKNCILVKHKDDNRYDPEYVVTHDKQKLKAICTKNLQDIITNKNIVGAEVICIDEIQFYEDAADICDLWANEGKIVIAAGLNGNYLREPFTQVSKLLAKIEMDHLIPLTAICTQTGKQASFTKRISNEKEVKVIGGSEKYISCSRQAYFSETNYENPTHIEKI
jgi:thymidine kinase